MEKMKKIYYILYLCIIFLYFSSCKTSNYQPLYKTSIFIYSKKIKNKFNLEIYYNIRLQINSDNTFTISRSGIISPEIYEGTWIYIANNKILLKCYDLKIKSEGIELRTPNYILGIINENKAELWNLDNNKHIILTGDKY